MGVVTMAWYFHAPSIMPDDECRDQVTDSLVPLLTLHERLGRRCSIAITSVFLERIQRMYPELVDYLVELTSIGRIEVLGTFFHEIFPPIVPLRYLKEQAADDAELKQEIFGVRPSIFFTPNFAWVPSLTWVLSDLGYKGVILDSGHHTLSTSVQAWNWGVDDATNIKSSMLRTDFLSYESSRRHSLIVDEKRSLSLFFRDDLFVRSLTFGNQGAIHKPAEEYAITRISDEMLHTLKSRSILLADDGDRINPISISAYETFLIAQSDAVWAPLSERLNEQTSASTSYLCSYSIGDFYKFWQSDLDAIYYKQIMDELYLLESTKTYEETMQYQDVYFIFWKNHWRKREIVKGIMDSIESHRMSGFN